MRLISALMAVLMLTACAGRDDLTEMPEPIGTFLLGHNVVVAPNLEKGPLSREASDAEWIAAVTQAVDDRFNNDRFPGSAYFHIGVAVEGYVLAQPGVPLVYTPRSVLIISVNFFEDATQTKLNEEPIQLTIFEPCCAPIIGSGLARSREEQLEGLAFNAARAIERTMREHADWFGGTAEVLPEDDTIIEGNVLEDNPKLILPEQTAPDDLAAVN